jgi:hypothetical protein
VAELLSFLFQYLGAATGPKNTVNIKSTSEREGGVCISKAGERFYVHTRIIFEYDSSSAAFINLIAKACDFISGPACECAPKEARVFSFTRGSLTCVAANINQPRRRLLLTSVPGARACIYLVRSRGGENEMCLST